MADTAVTPTTLAIDVASADILDAGGTAIGTASTDTFAIAAGGEAGRHIVLKFLVDASGDTITIKAGDRPPSQRVDLGDLTITMAANDVRYIVIETARFLQDDGTIRVDCTDDGTTCKAFILPHV